MWDRPPYGALSAGLNVGNVVRDDTMSPVPKQRSATFAK
jgi:hypothetical protein